VSVVRRDAVCTPSAAAFCELATAHAERRRA